MQIKSYILLILNGLTVVSGEQILECCTVHLQRVHDVAFAVQILESLHHTNIKLVDTIVTNVQVREVFERREACHLQDVTNTKLGAL